MFIFNILITVTGYFFRESLLDIGYINYWLYLLVANYTIGETIYLFKNIPYLNKYKLNYFHAQETKISTIEIYKTTLVNNLFFIPPLFIYKIFYYNYLVENSSNFINTCIEVTLSSALYLGIFEILHYLLHLK